MFTGIIIGVAAAVAAVIYFEIRHAYFARKITSATTAAANIAEQARKTAQAAQTTVEAVKTAVTQAAKTA